METLFVTQRSFTMIRCLWIVCLVPATILRSTLGTIIGTINRTGLIAFVVGTLLCHKIEIGMTSKQCKIKVIEISINSKMENVVCYLPEHC